MNPELEALLKAYDEMQQAQSPEADRLKGEFDKRIAEFMERHPTIRRETLITMLRKALFAWLKAQRQPPTLPPKA